MADEKKKGWFRGAIDKIEAQVESQKAQHAASAADAGSLAIQKSFGISSIAIYNGGYVRVSKVLGGRDLLPTTPYEKLKSIKYLEQRTGVLSLTIATDRKVHTLTTKREMLSAYDKAGMALEAAGQAVLATLGSSAAAAPAPAPTVAPDVADQIKKLADLHAAGVLTDDEFSAKKADLLRRI